ncbi:MAG: hypothetical protein JXB48_23215 [Candidatus Latescibacteria bacterium]|nr:hypothetical protein [Candidatus Latescibacterota bacterium]
MEILVQLIIVFIIIASILKRMQEISQKAKTLDKEKDLGQTIEMFGDENTPERAEQKPTGPSGLDKPVITFPTESFEIPNMPLEDMFETSSEQVIGESEKILEEKVVEIPLPTRHRLEKPFRMIPGECFKPGFSGSQVVTGIIMGEILGPPVSMRSNE